MELVSDELTAVGTDFEYGFQLVSAPINRASVGVAKLIVITLSRVKIHIVVKFRELESAG
jgi:methyl coenzyme M reductase subunit C